VSSLIEGWTARRGISYRLPERLDLADYRGRLWSYILPPGWREYASTSIAEVSAFQYIASNEAGISARHSVNPRSFVEVAFEELLARPVDEMRRLMEQLELTRSAAVLETATDIDSHQVGTISAPHPDKWRSRAADIAHVLPRLAPTMARLGYEPEPKA
jgi:hypothetical protein